MHNRNPHALQQTEANRYIQEVKKVIVNLIMNRVGCLNCLWVMCSLYVVYVLNHAAQPALDTLQTRPHCPLLSTSEFIIFLLVEGSHHKGDNQRLSNFRIFRQYPMASHLTDIKRSHATSYFMWGLVPKEPQICCRRSSDHQWCREGCICWGCSAREAIRRGMFAAVHNNLQATGTTFENAF